MISWREGDYNPSYIVGQKGLISQDKYKACGTNLKLEEISIEKYDNGQIKFIFTINTASKKPRDRATYINLLQDLQKMSTNLQFTTTDDELHTASVNRGDEYLLDRVLSRLQQYDPSLEKITTKLQKTLRPTNIGEAHIKDAILAQEQRIKLLKTILRKNGKSGTKTKVKIVRGRSRTRKLRGRKRA